MSSLETESILQLYQNLTFSGDMMIRSNWIHQCMPSSAMFRIWYSVSESLKRCKWIIVSSANSFFVQLACIFHFSLSCLPDGNICWKFMPFIKVEILRRTIPDKCILWVHQKIQSIHSFNKCVLKLLQKRPSVWQLLISRLYFGQNEQTGQKLKLQTKLYFHFEMLPGITM